MSDCYEGLSKMLEKELEKIVKKGDITPAELENVHKTIDIIEKIKMMEDYKNDYDDGYSDAYEYYPMRMNQYERGRSRTTGRYMSRGKRGSGYSSHSIKDRMIASLEKMMDDAGSEYERETVADWINRLEAEK